MGENKKFQRIGRRMVGKGHVYQLYEDELILPDKRKVYYDHVEHMGAAAVLPVLEDGRVILVSQYRNSIERMTLEIPAGVFPIMESQRTRQLLGNWKKRLDTGGIRRSYC